MVGQQELHTNLSYPLQQFIHMNGDEEMLDCYIMDSGNCTSLTNNSIFQFNAQSPLSQSSTPPSPYSNTYVQLPSFNNTFPYPVISKDSTYSNSEELSEDTYSYDSPRWTVGQSPYVAIESIISPVDGDFVTRMEIGDLSSELHDIITQQNSMSQYPTYQTPYTTILPPSSQVELPRFDESNSLYPVSLIPTPFDTLLTNGINYSVDNSYFSISQEPPPNEITYIPPTNQPVQITLTGERTLEKLKLVLDDAVRKLNIWKQNRVGEKQGTLIVDHGVETKGYEEEAQKQLDEIDDLVTKTFKQVLHLGNKLEVEIILKHYLPQFAVITKQPKQIVQYLQVFTSKVKILGGQNNLTREWTVTAKVIKENGDSVTRGSLDTENEFKFVIPKGFGRLCRKLKLGGVHNENFFIKWEFIDLSSEATKKKPTLTVYSHPFKIIVNCGQELQAMAAMTWEYACGPERFTFELFRSENRPKKLNLEKTAEAMNGCLGQNGINGLPFDSYKFIAKDILNLGLTIDNGIFYIDYKDFMPSSPKAKSQRNTLWDRFIKLKKLLERHKYVRKLWNQGKIGTYCTAENMYNQLIQFGQSGAFHLRLSTIDPNVLTIDWYHAGEFGSNRIYDAYLKKLYQCLMDDNMWTIHYPSGLTKANFLGTPSPTDLEQDDEDALPAGPRYKAFALRRIFASITRTSLGS